MEYSKRNFLLSKHIRISLNKNLFYLYVQEKQYIIGCHFILYFPLGVARKLASSGYGVFAMDYPGFGLSDGLHGYIPSFENLVDDVIEHFSRIKGEIYFLPLDFISHRNHVSLISFFIVAFCFGFFLPCLHA